MKLAVTIACTQNYAYAMKTLARRVAACLAYMEWTEPGIVIIAGDSSAKVKAACGDWKAILPANWEIIHLDEASEKPDAPNYKKDAQMTIAKLRSAAFTEARRHNPQYCWSLDSDTLPPANALACSIDMLEFDRGSYYSISTCPYPNDAFLGGRGNQFNQIAPDVIDAERIIPKELQEKIEALNADAKAADPEKKLTEFPKELAERKKELEEEVKKCPAAGSLWHLNDKFGWRQRGWLEQAYPGIGVGAVVPSDWCGFGCTLMNRKALALADFDGYDGGGTEDLFVIWRKWFPAGLRINVITHCPCDHVIWEKKKGGDVKTYTLVRAFHEMNGECIGHLRTAKSSWKEF